MGARGVYLGAWPSGCPGLVVALTPPTWWRRSKHDLVTQHSVCGTVPLAAMSAPLRAGIEALPFAPQGVQCTVCRPNVGNATINHNQTCCTSCLSFIIQMIHLPCGQATVETTSASLPYSQCVNDHHCTLRPARGPPMAPLLRSRTSSERFPFSLEVLDREPS
jgi:hypothetical protein